MTPEQLDKLRRIDAHLANLLSTAEKRTPGGWVSTSASMRHGYKGRDLTAVCFVSYKDREDESNAAYIASCAGNAEAGWKATRAAIAAAMQLQGISLSPCNGGSCMVTTDAEDSLEGEVNAFVQSILTAFPNV